MSGKTPSAQDLAAFEYDLIASAVAFLVRSVRTMRDDSNGHSATFAIAELATAVEVLMKARLVRYDWTQACADVKKWSFNDLRNGSARTVSPEEASTRLAKVAGVNMDRHSASIKSFARLRNRAVHLTLTTQGEQPVGVQAEYGRALDFVLSFLQAEFRGSSVGEDVVVLVDGVIDELTTEVGQIRALVDTRMVTLTDQLRSVEVVLVCPRCDQPALLLGDDSAAHCAFCLWSPDDGRVAAEEYVDMVLGQSRYESAHDGEPYPVEFCLDCGAAAHVEGLEPVSGDDADLPTQRHGDVQPAAFWGCFSCGVTADRTELDRCCHCETLTVVGTDTGVPICSDCFAKVIAKD
ncbi:hypothetical protein ACTXG7_08085 [Mycolicibacterium sp. Dal123E01]|uniref:hypothetical protein n=1 Tax=Mycolicibacterium sp. Dal123E01 TaxID=3457578 RepID=UPI00403E7CDF